MSARSCYVRYGPGLWEQLSTQLTNRLLAGSEIAEYQSLFSDSGGWLLLFGFLLILAFPYLIWASRRMLYDDRWTPLVIYGWYLLLLAAISVRFAGQLSIVVAIFAGLGFVHLADSIDVARRPGPFTNEIIDSIEVPERSKIFTLLGLFLLVTGLSIIQIPVKTSQITSPNEGYEAAAWMADYSEAEGMVAPENYVFSRWGHNRMYNYFVNGDSRSYDFARSNFESFLTGVDAGGWYNVLRNHVGFVVTTPIVVTNQSAIGTRLHQNNGSRRNAVAGMGHFRLVHVEDDGEYKVFRLVEGGVIRGTAASNASVTVRTTVELESYSFEYVRRTTADANGRFSVRVAHPGEYAVGGDVVVVNESAVVNGSTVRVRGNVSAVTTSTVRLWPDSRHDLDQDHGPDAGWICDVRRVV